MKAVETLCLNARTQVALISRMLKMVLKVQELGIRVYGVEGLRLKVWAFGEFGRP